MRDADKIVRERQKFLRREIDRRGIPIKAIQLDGGWDHHSTVLSYFPADREKDPAIMSLAALHRLFDALPLDLLSLLLPDGHAIVKIPDGADYDEYERHCRTFLSIKGEAHHPDSPAGRELSHCEEDLLDRAVVPLRAVG